MRFVKRCSVCLYLLLVLTFSACGKKEAPAVTTAPNIELPTTVPTETTVPPTTLPSYEISIGMTMAELREIMGSDGERLYDPTPRYSWILDNGQVLTVTVTEPDPLTEPRFPKDWLISEFKLDDGAYFREPSSIVITPAEVVPPTVPKSCEISLGMSLREVRKIMGSDGERKNDSILRYMWKLANGDILTLTFTPPDENAPRPLEQPADQVVRAFRFGNGNYFSEPSTITVSPAQPETEE